jgi:transcriptional regulator with XRE-family HTH domain
MRQENEIMIINTLATAIRSRGITQAQFAERMGVDDPTVSRLCKQRSFTFGRLQQICQALGTNEITEFIRVIEVK